jgi:hypothetical protein
MQIDLISYLIWKDSIFKYLKELERKGYGQDRINEEFKGMRVDTLYSKNWKHSYKIEKIDFSKSPLDGFDKKYGNHVTFKQ